MPLALVAHSLRGTRRAAVTAAVATGLAYYLGSLLGFALRLPPSTPSVLWPPNAILTSALLLTPTRWWPACLAAALPGHLATQLPMGWSVVMILLLFVTNCSEAILGAGLARRLTRGRLRLDRLHGLLVFLTAVVVVGPLVSTFADAAVVHAFKGESFWQVSKTRLFSNTLAELTIVPAAIGIVTLVTQRPRRWPLSRLVEATIVAAGLVFTELVAFSELSQLPLLQLVSSEAPLALPLPFLLWAAARFGPGGAGVASFLTTQFTVFVAVHSHGPFPSFAFHAQVLPLQLSLTVVTLTLLTLSTLVAERREALRELTNRWRLERLMSRLSSAFVRVPSNRMQASFDEWTERIGKAFRLDAVVLLEGKGGSQSEALSRWTRASFVDPSHQVSAEAFPWAAARVLAGEAILVDHSAPLPPDAVIDCASADRFGLRAAYAMPLSASGRVIGALVCGRRSGRKWREPQVTNLRLVANVLANALARKVIEDALRASESAKSALLDSLPMAVAVIDAGGQIETVNQRWAALGAGGDAETPPVGVDLTTRYRALSSARQSHFDEIAVGIQSVLDGSRHRFLSDRPRRLSDGRWWTFLAVRLNRESGGAVIINGDVTELRRAELEAQRHRTELAHVSRVSMLGELTTSLAHQLNQPLTAIMANASAARMLLDPAMPSTAQLREILSDIAEEDRRASDVIQRLREMLRKRELETTDVDIASAIDDVTGLVRSDAVIRRVQIETQLHDRPMIVRGDRVQLHQVFLNLIVNALEAIGAERQDRNITIAAHRNDHSTILVSVADSGSGLSDASAALIFNPFYTTKPSGLGMGLSIARSIVEAHGGSIRATNRPTGGAVFEITLPSSAPGYAGDGGSGLG